MASRAHSPTRPRASLQRVFPRSPAAGWRAKCNSCAPPPFRSLFSGPQHFSGAKWPQGGDIARLPAVACHKSKALAGSCPGDNGLSSPLPSVRHVRLLGSFWLWREYPGSRWRYLVRSPRLPVHVSTCGAGGKSETCEPRPRPRHLLVLFHLVSQFSRCEQLSSLSPINSHPIEQTALILSTQFVSRGFERHSHGSHIFGTGGGRTATPRRAKIRPTRVFRPPPKIGSAVRLGAGKPC